MRRLGRFIWITLALLLVATAAGAALPHFAIELYAPHVARRSAATIEAPLHQLVEAGLDKAKPTTVDSVLDFSLSATDKLLHFGLSHPTSLTFAAVDREGNCIEYAHLFAKIFDEAATGAGLKAKAYVVHTAKARVFGQKVPLRGWDDHDWVLIDDRSDEPRRLYVDPTLHDAGLGWDIASSVKGAVKLP